MNFVIRQFASDVGHDSNHFRQHPCFTDAILQQVFSMVVKILFPLHVTWTDTPLQVDF
jgi:hypothetical protein